MKKALLFLVCCLGVMGGARAQTTWCPTGAEWSYWWTSMADDGYLVYHYQNDTVFNNQPCHKIESTYYTSQHGPPGYHHYDTAMGSAIYTYSAGDTVYFYNGVHKKFMPYYYFGAQAGDSLLIPNLDFMWGVSSDSFVHVIVDSTGLVQANSLNLRYYVFHITDSCSFPYPFTGRVVERLGMMDNNLIPSWRCVTDDDYYSFCSYQDSGFPNYPAGSVCRLVNSIAELSNTNFSLSPNPATTSVTITTTDEMIGSTITITDIMGRKVLVTPLSTANRELSTDFPNGIYLLTLTTPNGKSATKKLVISK